MKANIEQIKEQANAIAYGAEAIAAYPATWTVDELRAAVVRIQRNVEVLAAWVQD